MADESNSNDKQAPGSARRLSDESDTDNTQPGDAAASRSADGASDSSGDGVENISDQLAKVRSEFLYLYAEFENYKKNAIKERSDLRKYGSERLVVDLLNVLDIFETALALEPTTENAASFRKGIEMTATELKATLQRNGIEEMPALGTAFNPNHHEALSSEESADLPPGHVSRVFKKPYKLHERVVRPGQVVVAKAKG